MKTARLFLCLALAGCAASHRERERPPATDQPVASPAALALEMPRNDTAQAAKNGKGAERMSQETFVAVRRGLFSFLRKPKAAKETAGNATQVPRKCKHCQITIITGDGNRVAQAAAGKVKAPVVLASDSATATDQRGATNAVSGTGITATQTSTAPKPASVGATIADRLAGPLGYVAAAAAWAGLAYVLWLLLPLLPRRRKNDTPTT